MAYQEGDSFALPSSTRTCAECQRLLATQQDSTLADRLSPDYDDWGRVEVVAHLHRRAGGGIALPPEPLEVARLRKQGFVALHEYTGVADTLGPLWPVDDRVRLNEPPWHDADSDETWMVRSPSPSMTVEEVIDGLLSRVEREQFKEDR